MVFQQDVRINYWNLLKRRKRSIRNFLDLNGITNVTKFDFWLKNNNSQYIFTEDFKKEVFCHLEGKENVEVKNEFKSIEDKEEKNSEIKEEILGMPLLSIESEVLEMKPSVSENSDSFYNSEEDSNYSANQKKIKKKKQQNETND